MSGEVIDSPLVNSYVVGVDYDHPGEPNVTGANAGTPGTWTPAGYEADSVPKTLQALMNHVPPIVANPLTPWTAGQYVQTRTAGAPGEATWTGTAWVGGRAVGTGVFDPGDHTVDECKQYVTDHPDQTQAVYDAEAEGKARSSLLDWLTGS